MDFIMSPSSLKTFRDCPRKFYKQYITKELPYQQSPAAIRGETLHKFLETAVKDGWNNITWPEKENALSAEGFIDAVWRLKASGWTVLTEMEAATDGYGNQLSWYEKPPKGFLRSRIDVCATHPDKDYAIVIDWKTGKPWDDELQLYVNALCLYPFTGLRNYHVMFCYIDSGMVKSNTVSLEVLQPKMYMKTYPHPTDNMKMQFVLDLMKDLELELAGGDWRAKQNRFCRWCPVEECDYK